MGTNYYAQEPCPNACKHCTPVRLHICKSLTGFQGYEDSSFGRIESWADWKRVLRSHHLEVFDEYDVTIEVEKFIEAVEATSVPARRHQYEFMQTEYLNTHTGFMFPEWQNDYWLDPDQFTFTYRDFS